MSRLISTLLVLAVLIGLPVLGYRQARYNSVREVTLTVTTLPDNSKFNANGDKNPTANLVFTDKGTFQNTNSWFPRKKDSVELYNQLHEGSTYQCELAGWRWEVIKQYPDIISCGEVL